MRYALKAVDGANQVVTLELEAHDEVSARALARQQGYSAFAVRPAMAWGRLAGRKQRFPTLLFSIELLGLLEAGLNVVEALQALAEKESGTSVLSDLLAALQRGQSLSSAVEAHPRAFSPLYVATIRSSERTGSLQEALARYIAYEEELGKVRSKVVAALLYPAILAVAGVGVLAFLVFYVVPRFARVYQDISTPLPLFSSALLAVGGWIERNLALALLICAALVACAVWAAASERVRTALGERLWRLPALGRRLHVYHLARIYRTVAMLLRAGIPAVKALEMVRPLLAVSLRPRLAQAIGMLTEGRTISASMTTAGLATPVAARLLAVGEKSGAMGEQMERIARFCDDETLRVLDAFMRVFEPLLMAALGISIGAIVVLMYMPVFELAGSLQ